MSLATGLFFPVLLWNQRWSPPLRLQASHCSTFRIMCDVPSIAVFCSESIECFPGTASKFFLKLLVTIPVAPIITGIIAHFRFHIRCISIHKLLYFNFSLLLLLLLPIPVAARSKAWDWCYSLAGVTGSNPAGARKSECVSEWVLCVVRNRSLRRVDHSSRGDLPSVVCLSVIVKSWPWSWPTVGCSAMKFIIIINQCSSTVLTLICS